AVVSSFSFGSAFFSAFGFSLFEEGTGGFAGFDVSGSSTSSSAGGGARCGTVGVASFDTSAPSMSVRSSAASSFGGFDDRRLSALGSIIGGGIGDDVRAPTGAGEFSPSF